MFGNWRRRHAKTQGKAATDCNHAKPKMEVFGSAQCSSFPCVSNRASSLKFAVCYLTEHRFGRNEEQFASFWRRKIKQPIRIVKHALQHTLGDRPMTGIADEVGSVFVFGRITERDIHAHNFMFNAAVIILRNHIVGIWQLLFVS